MSEPQTSQKRPASEGYETWRDYWKAQGMSWRTEPEIDEERQQYLSERRSIKPDIRMGVYPFKDVKLDRADVEWLLATHNRGNGIVGPEVFSDDVDGALQGVDVRGADLRGANLRKLPLLRLYAGLVSEERDLTQPAQWEMAAAQMQGAVLFGSDLRLSCLSDTRLEGADLTRARLEEVYLGNAHLDGCHLMQASFDKSALRGATLRGTFFDQVQLGNTNLAPINWRAVKPLGEEVQAYQRRDTLGQRKSRQTRIGEFEAAVRANRLLATALRNQGLSTDADRFGYKAQVIERQVLRRQRQSIAFLGSWFLDLISGYGYRPIRSFITYALVVLAFAAAYFALGGANGQPLSWNEALVVSMTAFHGRGFFAAVFQPGDIQAAVAAVEAFIGLLIEIVFIATFTQRFFAR
jgi:uncharacterized protein YjbI with pentapeptide repeats